MGLFCFETEVNLLKKRLSFFLLCFLIDAKYTAVTEQFKVKGNLCGAPTYISCEYCFKVLVVTLDVDVDLFSLKVVLPLGTRLHSERSRFRLSHLFRALKTSGISVYLFV